MKTLRLFAFGLLMMCAAAVAQAATASYSNGKLTLDFIGEWAVVENGNGNIAIVDAEGIQLATVVGDPDWDMTNTQDYQVLVYNVAGRVDAGSYTVKIADGAIVGHKTDPWSWDLSSIGAMELPLVVTDGEGGEVSDDVASFGAPDMEIINGAGINVKYTYPNSVEPENYYKGAAEGKTATLYENGVQVATAAFAFNFEPTYFYGAHFDYTEVEGNEYKAVFPEGCWYIEQMDEMGNATVVLTSPSETYTWTGGDHNGTVVDPSQPGEEPNPGDNDDPTPSSPVTVDFKLGESVAAITNNMVIANITVDRAYYDIYWTVTSPQDPEFFFGGSSHAASAGEGTYTIIASTPSSQPVELNSGNTYVFTFQTCEFGWDGYQTVATFEVAGAGSAAEQFSDVTITSFDGTMGALGYDFKNNYTFTFSAPVYDVQAFAPLGMDGVVRFDVTKQDQEGLTWSVNVSSMANDEGSFEMHIQAREVATGLRLKGNYSGDNSFIYTIHISNSNPDDSGDEPELPGEEVEIATLTIGQTVYHLSQENAIELATYPAGAVFTITLADEAIKKVTYEIIDNTTGEILKSIADLNKGDEGQWTATMPLTYEMVAGHLYYVHVVARDGMSSFTSNVLQEYNFLVMGTNSNVATYSTVKVVSLTPGTNQIIREATPVISITFSEAIASLRATAVLGQMSSMAIPAQNITTEDNTTWQISIPAGVITGGSLQLNIVAIDNEGNRVTDERDGVGLPENCYLNYGWASTVGLPTPRLTENGTTVESLKSLHFTYDGIGLNADNATATWNQITIARDGEVLDLEITEDMFVVTGDESVGGSVLVMTLTNELTEVGEYTITVPAYAFMLGHDQSNFYSGDCEFVVTVYNTTTGVETLVQQQNGTLYRLNGTKAESLQGGIYIQNGHKVIVK